MSWSGISSNQTVSRDNLQDAVNNGLFSLTSSLASPGSREMTKSEAVSKLDLTNINQNYPPFAGRTPNQLIVKDDIYHPGMFYVYSDYGVYVSDIICTGRPSLNFPIYYSDAGSYQTSISSQYIRVDIDGYASVSYLYAELYVDNVLIDSQNYTYNSGAQYTTLYLSQTVLAPSRVEIWIKAGTAPYTPPPPDLSSKPADAVSVSRSTGQYMAIGGSISRGGPHKQGYIYVSSDYGSSWTQKGFLGYWRKIAHSDNGQYVLAVESYGYAYKSDDYGATWSVISNFPAPNGTSFINSGKLVMYGCALSSDGQYQVISTGVTTFSDTYAYAQVYYSSDYGSSWSIKHPDGVYKNTNYMSVDMNSDGSNIIVTSTDVGLGWKVFKSTNNTSSWSFVAGGFGAAATEVSMTSDGTNMLMARYSTQVYTQMIASTSSGSNGTWSVITGGGAGSQDVWYRVAAYYSGGPQGYATPVNYATKIRRVTSLTSASTISSSPSKGWTSIDCSNNGQYVLAASTTGIYISTDTGANWTMVT